MARDLSATARRALFAQTTGEVFLVLLELTHSSFGTIRLTSDNLPTVHRGGTYEPFPFAITIPDETEENPPTVTLSVDNVDRRIYEIVRGASGVPITVRMFIVLASTPDVIESGAFEFALRNVRADAQKVEGTLMFEDLLRESFPAGRFTPSLYPGLF